MAQAAFNDLAKKTETDAVAFSAGLYTDDGLPYSQNTLDVLAENGIVLTGASRRITEEMLAGCDLVFGLTYSLSTALVSAFPANSDSIYRFPLEVPDPFGGDIVLYRRSFAKIREGVEKILAAIRENKL